MTHPQACDFCNRLCGATQYQKVHIAYGERWCHACWLRYGERRTEARNDLGFFKRKVREA